MSRPPRIDHDFTCWHTCAPMRAHRIALVLIVTGAASPACWSSGNRNGPSRSGGSCGGSTRPALGTVTSCAGSEAPLTALADLCPIAELPDPFLSLDGTRITSADQWACRRAEIAAQAKTYELGPKPGKPQSVTATFADGTINVTVSEGGRTITFPATITLPPASAAATAPYPAMIGMGGIAIDAAGLNN